MKETLVITDEAYRSDMERLWRKARQLRDTTRYSNVSFTVQYWMLACDGQNLKSGASQNANITELFFKLAEQPTNGELIAALGAAGVDVTTDLPARLTFSIDIVYTPIQPA